MLVLAVTVDKTTIVLKTPEGRIIKLRYYRGNTGGRKIAIDCDKEIKITRVEGDVKNED